MTDQPDEVIIIKFILDAQKAIADSKSLEAETEKIRTQLQLLSATSGQSFKNLAAAMQTQKLQQYNAEIAKIRAQLQTNIATVKGNTTAIIQYHQSAVAAMSAVKAAYTQTGQAINQASQQLQQANKQWQQSLQQTNASAKSAGGGFGILGQAIGTALGFSAVQMVQKVIGAIGNLIQYLNEAAQSGYEFAKGMFQLEIGVNALRRAGTDISFAEVLAQLQKLKSEFGIFATKDLVVGASAFLNLNRDMGFTKEQLFSLQDAIATLAVVNGRSMDEVQKTVALALSSGYTEGLQRLGVSINRVTIAEEAARLGWDKGYTALTEQQRALATYNLVLRKTAVYSDDLLKYQETLPGKIDTLTASITDLNAATGEGLLPLQRFGKELELIKATFLNWMVENSAIINFFERWDTFSAGWKNILGSFSEVPSNNPITFFKNLSGAIKEAVGEYKNLWDSMRGEVKVAVKPIGITQFESKELTEDQVEAVENAGQEILDLQEQYDIDRRDMAIDLQRDLAEIEQDGADKIEDIMADHAQKMLDISNKASDQIRDAQLRYDLDVQQAWDDYYSNLASAAESHSNKLLKIEEDYQEKLKRLKEGFLMDLEDALHERDARQVLRLIRQYNLDRTQATRERDQNLREEARAYEEQLHELDRQRRDRLKKLREELDLRLRMIATQRDRELALEVEKYNHEMAQQAEKNRKDREERLLKYQEDLNDLDLHLKDRIQKLVDALINENNITAEGLNNILGTISSYLGPGGAATKVYDFFVQYAQAAIAAAMGAMAMLSTINMMPGSYWYSEHTNPPANPFKTPNKAKGGIEYADKPTTALFGEAGPELALFMPLSGGIGSLSASTKIPAPEMKQGDKGKLMVEVLLGAGLEGRIINKALNETANVVLRSIK